MERGGEAPGVEHGSPLAGQRGPALPRCRRGAGACRPQNIWACRNSAAVLLSVGCLGVQTVCRASDGLMVRSVVVPRLCHFRRGLDSDGLGASGLLDCWTSGPLTCTGMLWCGLEWTGHLHTKALHVLLGPLSITNLDL